MIKNQVTRDILIVILISLIYFLPGILSPRDFWVEDEARYGEILREMVHEGEWWVPHLNGHFYPDKPPTYFWLCAFVSILIGKITPNICMFITWLSTAGTLVVTYLFSKMLFNRKTGLKSAFILMSTFLFLGCAQIVRMDMQMTLFTTWALYVFYLGLRHDNPRYYTVFYLMAGLAVLSKGPLGLSFPLIPAIVFLIYRKAWHQLKIFFFHWGWLLVFLLVGGWLGGAFLIGQGDFVRTIFTEQIAGRAVKSFIHKQPFYFYLMLLPAMLLPWSAFIIRACKHQFQSSREIFWLLAWWFVTGMLVISLISGKLFIYVLPLLPPLAMFLGAFFQHLFENNKRILLVEGITMILLAFGLFVATPFIADKFPSTGMMNFWPLAWIFIPWILLGFILLFLKKTKLFFGYLILGMWIFSTYAFQGIVPQTNEIMSARSIGYDIKSFTEQGYEAGVYNVRRGILNFYADTRMTEIPGGVLFNWFDSPNRIMLTRKRYYNQHAKALGDSVSVFKWYNISNQDYVLLYKKSHPSENLAE